MARRPDYILRSQASCIRCREVVGSQGLASHQNGKRCIVNGRILKNTLDGFVYVPAHMKTFFELTQLHCFRDVVKSISRVSNGDTSYGLWTTPENRKIMYIVTWAYPTTFVDSIVRRQKAGDFLKAHLGLVSGMYVGAEILHEQDPDGVDVRALLEAHMKGSV